MTNHVSFAAMLKPPAWAASLDLKDAYLHVPIKKTLHKYLAFMVNKKLFFKALLFGLGIAPFLFTRIMRYPLGLLHQQGISVLAYLDNWIVWGPSPEETYQSVLKTTELLSNLGLLINKEKSQPVPLPEMEWLGIQWFTQSGHWGIPQQKQMELMNVIKDSTQTRLAPAEVGRDSSLRISELRNTNFDPISSSLAAAPSTSTSRFDFYMRPTTPSAWPIEESSHPLDEPFITQAKRNLLRRSQSCPNMDRCIPNRMGRIHKFFLCNKILESNRDETAHKHSRDKSSLPHISTTQSGEQDNPFIHRQCTSAMRNKQAFMQISETPKWDSNPSNVQNFKRTRVMG